jgi:putative sterol carrier protein
VSEIETIFRSLPSRFQPGKVTTPRSFYFSLDEEKWTVSLGKDACTVEPGNTRDADCFFKASSRLFLEVWNGRYQISPKDFVSGAIKSNNPMLLKEFVAAFR